MAHRAALLGVETGQQGLDPLRLFGWGRFFRRRPPDRYLLEFTRFAWLSLASLTSHLERLARGCDNSRVTSFAWIYRWPGLRWTFSESTSASSSGVNISLGFS